jgi:hypothetical protein
MKRDLERDLRELEQLAFSRLKYCEQTVRRFHLMEAMIEASGYAKELWRIYEWLLVPYTLWPIEFVSLANFVLESVASGEAIEPEVGTLLSLIDSPPRTSTREAVRKYEYDVQSGKYEKLTKQHQKFEAQERALLTNRELQADWESIKHCFKVEGFQNRRGVVRRRLSQERNFREGWELDWGDEKKRFQVMLDALCYRWRLYGFEKDRPLLMKVTVNLTPHGTMIMIPGHLSLDPRRDLDWRKIARLHRLHGAERQGPKLSAAKLARLEEAKLARKLWAESKVKGLKGAERFEYVRVAMKKERHADPGWLKRLLRVKV